MVTRFMIHTFCSHTRRRAPRHGAIFALALLLLGTPLCDTYVWGQSKAAAVRRAPDKNVVKREIQLFENNLDVRLSKIPNAMIAVVDRAKGAYLKDYGVVFTFLVNINRTVLTTPFGIKRVGKEQTAQEKQKRVDEILEMLILALKEDPRSFRSLGPNDAIVIVAHFDDSNELDDVKRNKTYVLKIFKRDLDAYKSKGYEEFKKQVATDEY